MISRLSPTLQARRHRRRQAWYASLISGLVLIFIIGHSYSFVLEGSHAKFVACSAATETFHSLRNGSQAGKRVLAIEYSLETLLSDMRQLSQFGLGIKTHAILTKAGIPCQVILDSAVAFAMPQVDMVLLGAEALAENGGLINFVSGFLASCQIAKQGLTPMLFLSFDRLVAIRWLLLRNMPISQSTRSLRASNSSAYCKNAIDTLHNSILNI